MYACTVGICLVPEEARKEVIRPSGIGVTLGVL